MIKDIILVIKFAYREYKRLAYKRALRASINSPF
jgi:hypothetical protein